MQLKIDNEFKEICFEILNENKTDEEWGEISSCDMFQSDHYCGGYESLEKAFYFSYYDLLGQEFWFQVTLNDIKKIAEGKIEEVTIKLSE
jgi:hypothetical protein